MNSIAFFVRRGVLYSIAGVISKLIPAKVFRFRYFVVFKLKKELDRQRNSAKVECVNCDRIELIGQAERLSRFDHRQFRRPVKAALARIDDIPVGSLWFTQGSFFEEELGIEFQLETGQCWLFGAMVDRPFRGQKVFSQLLGFTSKQLANEGNVDQYAAVNPLNKSSMAVFSSHSEAIVARAFAIRIFGLSFCVCGGSLESERNFSFDCKRKPVQLKINRTGK